MNSLGQVIASGYDLSQGGEINGTLLIDGDLKTDVLEITGKYKLPIDPPPEPNAVITSDGSTQLIWTGDISIGDVSSVAPSTVNNELVLYNGTTGKSIKNSGVTCTNGLLSINDEELKNDLVNSNSSLIEFKKSRAGSAIIPSDRIGQVNFKGHDGSTYFNSAFLECYTVNTFTPTNHGSQIAIYTTNDNETNPTKKMDIWDDGTQITDNLITPNIYIGNGDKGQVMYIQGYNNTGDGLEIRDKNDNLIYALQDNGITINDRTADVTGGYLELYRARNGAPLSTNDEIGSLYWSASSGLGDRNIAEIKAVATENYNNPTSYGSRLIVETVSTGDTTPTEKMTIDNDVNIKTNLNVLDNDLNVKGNLKSIVIQDTASGAGLCNGSLSFNDINNSGVHTLSAPFGVMTFYHLGVPELSISPTDTISFNNTTSKGSLTIGDVGAGTQYVFPSTKGTTGQHLRLNGNDMEWATDAGGNVTGGLEPSTVNMIPRFDNTLGTAIKSSPMFCDNAGSITTDQGFQNNLRLPYLLYNNNQITYTVTGTTPVNLIPTIVNSFFPVNGGGFSWQGRRVRIIITGTVMNANNQQLFVDIGFLNRILTANGSGDLPTLNIAPGGKLKFTFDIDFRNNPTVLQNYNYNIDLAQLGGTTQWNKTAYLANSVDQTISTQPLYIRAYWSTADINNQFLCRSTEVYII